MSFSRLFNSISTLPHYLEMIPAGLDISDQAVRLIKFSKNENGTMTQFFGEEKLSQGVVVSGEIAKKDELIKTLSLLRKKCPVKLVKASLPEEKAYFFKTEIPKIAGEEIRQSIEFRLEENIPLKADESLFSFSLIKSNHQKDGHLDVSVSVVPKTVAENYSDVLTESGFFPVSFEIESGAMVRSVSRHEDNLSSMVVNVRDNSTVVAIVKDGSVRFTSSFAIGGNTITKSLQKNFSTSFQEAEKMKEDKMFAEGKESVAIFFSLIEIMAEFKDEISKFYSYWLAKSDSVGESGGKISKIILCGKDSAICGFKDYLSQCLKIKVEIGDVWGNAFSVENNLQKINFLQSLNLAVVIGLALPEKNYTV